MLLNNINIKLKGELMQYIDLSKYKDVISYKIKLVRINLVLYMDIIYLSLA